MLYLCLELDPIAEPHVCLYTCIRVRRWNMAQGRLQSIYSIIFVIELGVLVHLFSHILQINWFIQSHLKRMLKNSHKSVCIPNVFCYSNPSPIYMCVCAGLWWGVYGGWRSFLLLHIRSLLPWKILFPYPLPPSNSSSIYHLDTYFSDRSHGINTRVFLCRLTAIIMKTKHINLFNLMKPASEQPAF